MSSTRKTALIAGALFVITFLTSIPAALLLYTPVLDHTNYIVGAGADTRVALGAFLEVLLIIANVGSAVVLFPVLNRQNESPAPHSSEWGCSARMARGTKASPRAAHSLRTA